MNKENVEALIETINRGNRIYLGKWQAHNYNPCKSVEEINELGTAACIGGYMALTPKFQKDGGRIGDYGCPILMNEYKYESYGVDAGIIWLDIPYRNCHVLFGIYNEDENISRRDIYKFYNVKNMYEIGKEKVLEVLHRLRDTGSIYE